MAALSAPRGRARRKTRTFWGGRRRKRRYGKCLYPDFFFRSSLSRFAAGSPPRAADRWIHALCSAPPPRVSPCAVGRSRARGAGRRAVGRCVEGGVCAVDPSSLLSCPSLRPGHPLSPPAAQITAASMRSLIDTPNTGTPGPTRVCCHHTRLPTLSFNENPQKNPFWTHPAQSEPCRQ